MTNKILLIGAGQLGSRHLQALCKSSIPMAISVVDPSDASLALAKSRAEEIKPDPEFITIDYKTDIPGEAFDVVVIATSANVRLRVMQSFFERASTRFMILEKVLFQTIQDYKEARALLEKHDVKAWVNCPRRMNPLYRALTKKLADLGGLKSMHVTGNNWGLACNSIHFIDLFAFLSGNHKIISSESQLEPRVTNSKRKEFIECFGKLGFENSSGQKISIECSESDEPISITVSLCTDKGKIDISETSKLLNAPGPISQELPDFEQPPQSQLTQLNISQLLETGGCDLTPFEESVQIHLPFIQTILTHVNQFSDTAEKVCPIT